MNLTQKSYTDSDTIMAAANGTHGTWQVKTNNIWSKKLNSNLSICQILAKLCLFSPKFWQRVQQIGQNVKQIEQNILPIYIFETI